MPDGEKIEADALEKLLRQNRALQTEVDTLNTRIRDLETELAYASSSRPEYDLSEDSGENQGTFKAEVASKAYSTLINVMEMLSHGTLFLIWLVVEYVIWRFTKYIEGLGFTSLAVDIFFWGATGSTLIFCFVSFYWDLRDWWNKRRDEVE